MSGFRMDTVCWLTRPIVVAALCLGLVETADAHKFGLHGIYMEPNGADAEDYSGGAGGIGGHLLFALPRPVNMLGVTVGLENVVLHSDKKRVHDVIRYELHTSQRYTRFFLGGELGGHGRGFLRPHVGMNIAVVNYGFSVDAVIRDDHDPEDEVRQEISGENKWVFGQDLTFGLDVLVHKHVYVDLGVRYLKSYSVPQPLLDGPVTVHPEYFQVYLGIGINIEASEMDEFGEEPTNGDTYP